MALLVAAGAATGALAAQVIRVLRLPSPGEHAPPAGSATAGMRYAFTTAFAPWAKESGRRHPLAYGIGVLLHMAAALAVGLALWSVWRPLPAVGWAGGTGTGLLAAGVLAGSGLLARRALSARLRTLSAADDYISSGLVTVTVATSLAAVVGVLSPAVFRTATAVLLLYVPLGKLRHMVFLPASRIFWGRNLGRRGVLPPPRAAVDRS